MTTVGKNIQILRKASGLTQEALASQLHVTRQAVSSWETGKTEPDLETLQTIATALHAELSELIYGPGHTGHTEAATYPRFQRRHVLACLVLGAISLLCLVLRFTWIPHLREAVRETFVLLPLYRAHLLTACLLGFCTAALFPSILALVTDMHVYRPVIRRLLLILGLFFLALEGLYSMSFFLIPAVYAIFFQWLPFRLVFFCFFSYPIAPFLGGLCIGWWRA